MAHCISTKMSILATKLLICTFINHLSHAGRGLPSAGMRCAGKEMPPAIILAATGNYCSRTESQAGRRRAWRIRRPKPLCQCPLHINSRSSAMAVLTMPPIIFAMPRKGML